MKRDRIHALLQMRSLFLNYASERSLLGKTRNHYLTDRVMDEYQELASLLLA